MTVPVAGAVDVLSGLRDEIAAVLGDRYETRGLVPDAVAGPCLVLSWADPWLEPMTACNYTVRPSVLCVAGRVGVDASQVTLEEMVAYCVVRLRQLPRGSAALDRVETPMLVAWGNVDYLQARVVLRAMVNLSP